MSERARELGERLTAFNNQMIAFVEQCSDPAWNRVCPTEEWSVGVTARHIAAGHFEVVAMAKMMLTGEKLPPITMDQLTEMANAHAREHAGCGKEEVLGLLRKNGTALVDFAAALQDSELDRSAYLTVSGGEVTTQQLIEFVVLGSAGEHFEHIRKAVEG